MNKPLAIYAATWVLMFSSVHSANAQWVVTDPGNTAQNIAQVVGQIEEIANQVEQITNQYTQITYKLQQLELLAEGDFGVIAGYVALHNEDVANLIETAETLRYSIATIQRQIDDEYPQGRAQWGSFNMETINDTRQKWDDIVSEAGSTAARAQSSLDRVRHRNVTLNNLISAASHEAGDVRQAQIGNQINGTLAQGVNELVSVQTTANRLEMVRAQTEVAENEVSREQRRRLYEGYDDSGPSGTSLSAFPELR